MQQYIHTPETFNIFYNETTSQLKEHNTKLISLECYKETLLRQEHTITRLESSIIHLQEKNSYLAERMISLDTQVQELNRTLLKYFAYGKQIKETPLASATGVTAQPCSTTNSPSFSFKAV